MQRADPMLQELLSGYHLILGSGSPRRRKLLQEMGLVFEVRVPAVEENFPDTLAGAEIPKFIARSKAKALENSLGAGDILLTADTVVLHKGRLLGKPAGAAEAEDMLFSLSDSWHEVITSVCGTKQDRQLLLHETTRVRFRKLRKEEIAYYVSQFQPWDKAGAYGIQEWIGLVGIKEIRGSYTNVVGLPTAGVYELLRAMAS